MGFNLFRQGKDDEAPAAKNRRHIWEMYADVRAINTFLLAFGVVSSLATIAVACVLIAIYARPPYILTEDEGFVMWRTTEAFKLRSHMVTQFLKITLEGIYNVTPADYDITPILSYITPSMANQLTGDSRESASIRVKSDKRTFFNIIGIKRHYDTKYPQFVAAIVKADETVMSDSRDENGNLITSSKSSILFVTAYLANKRPTPENPWGLYLVGLKKDASQQSQVAWEEGTPFATKDTRTK